MLEGYKAKGLDLSKWIGLIPVKVSVEVPPTDGLESLINGMKKVYTGKTVITLSEDATAEQPILKMTNNPMGLTEFMYDMLRKETVENDMYLVLRCFEEGEVVSLYGNDGINRAF